MARLPARVGEPMKLNPVPECHQNAAARHCVPRRYSWHHVPSGKRGVAWAEACNRFGLLAALNKWNVAGAGVWVYTQTVADDAAEMPT